MATLIATEVGRRVHVLIASVAAGAEDPRSQAYRIVDRAPVEGAVRGSVLTAMLSAFAVYRDRLWPQDAELVGAEVLLTGCRADLVWRHSSGQIAIDELKWSSSRRRATKQVRALAQSGGARWGASFAGVRYCPLQAVSNTDLIASNGADSVSSLVLPAWLEVR